MRPSRPITLTNTMGRKLEEFKPLNPGDAKVYSCGPTVYNYQHIGNFRAFLFADSLRRMLDYNGYRVTHVRNITDVGHLTEDTLGAGLDKMERAAQREGKSPGDIADFYTERFFQDAERLNIRKPEYLPKATEYIAPMIELVERLIEAGKAYASDGNVYFEVSTFPEYGKLSGNSVEDLILGSRVEVGEGKRAPADFAAWRFTEPDKLMRYESPWGEGVPGWHLECSAMAFSLLGEQIDIHTGGEDHIFPHHEDEIAQSEGASGHTFANYWLHNAFLQLPGDEKMSKSAGNFLTLDDLQAEGIDPLAFRYFTFQAHYRTPQAFSWEALRGCQTALDRLWRTVAELRQEAEPQPLSPEGDRHQELFHVAINRDLDMPGAVAALHGMLSSDLPAGEKLTLAADFDEVLRLDLLERGGAMTRIGPAEEELLEKRAEARKAKDWARSDELRDQLRALGVEVKDTAEGQRWTKVEV